MQFLRLDHNPMRKSSRLKKCISRLTKLKVVLVAALVVVSAELASGLIEGD